MKTVYLRFSGGLRLDNLDGLDGLILKGSVHHIGSNGSDAVNNVHTLYNVTECCVLSVKVLCILVYDEELRGSGVGVLCACHGNNTANVGDGVVVTVHTELALDVLLGAAHAGACGVAALNHKAVNNSVEDKAVVEAFLSQLFEIFNSNRSRSCVKLELDLAAVHHCDLDHDNDLPFIDEDKFNIKYSNRF